MPVAKIAITLDRELVKEIDRGVKSGLFRNRSRAIEEAEAIVAGPRYAGRTRAVGM